MWLELWHRIYRTHRQLALSTGGCGMLLLVSRSTERFPLLEHTVAGSLRRFVVVVVIVKLPVTCFAEHMSEHSPFLRQILIEYSCGI